MVTGNNRLGNIIVLILAIAAIFLFHFYKLGYLPFYPYDEARLATSAYEMVKSGNWIVTTVNYVPDWLGTKPPLMIWAQAICIKLMGLKEFSVRFPAAVCALITIGIVFTFVFRLTRSAWAGLMSTIVLCTAQCYLFEHGSRNGEYDSMLALFTTCTILSLYAYTEATGSNRKQWLVLFFFFLAISTLTKGVAGLLFCPAFLVYLLWRKQVVSTVLNSAFWAGCALYLIAVSFFYVLREVKDPGYLQAMANQELLRRFNDTIEGHRGPWDFYWGYLKGTGFGNWYWALPLALFLPWFFPKGRITRAVVFCMLMAIGLLVIISFAQTKLWWYVLPAIPLFAIVIAILTDQISGALSVLLKGNKQLITILFMAIFSFVPVTEAWNRLQNAPVDLAKDNYFAASYYFRDALRGKKNLDGYIYLAGDFDHYHWMLYISELNEAGTHIKYINCANKPQLHPGDKVIANFANAKQYIEGNYDFDVIEEYYGVRNYIIRDIKSM